MSTQAPVRPELFRYLATDPVADLLGIVFEEIRPGYARARMPVTHRLLNAPGSAHGGAMMALVDVVHAAVSNSHGVLAVAQDVHTEFLAAGAEGDVLVCEGVELSRTQRTAVYRIDVRADREGHPGGRLLATALARVFRIGTPLLPEPAGEGDVGGGTDGEGTNGEGTDGERADGQRADGQRADGEAAR